jgi:hypothetical protein
MVLFLIKKAANNVRALADQTIRAIQPLKCSGAKCAAPINPNPIMDFGMQIANAIPNLPFPSPIPSEMDVLMRPQMAIPRYPLNNFVFKQNNQFRNLRG